MGCCVEVGLQRRDFVQPPGISLGLNCCDLGALTTSQKTPSRCPLIGHLDVSHSMEIKDRAGPGKWTTQALRGGLYRSGSHPAESTVRGNLTPGLLETWLCCTLTKDRWPHEWPFPHYLPSPNCQPFTPIMLPLSVRNTKCYALDATRTKQTPEISFCSLVLKIY